MEAPTAAAAIVLMLHTLTSNVPAEYVSDMTALGGSANPKVKGIAQPLLHHRLKALHPILTHSAVRVAVALAAAVAVGAAAVAVGAAAVTVGAAAVAVVVVVQALLREMVEVSLLAGTLALPVPVH